MQLIFCLFGVGIILATCGIDVEGRRSRARWKFHATATGYIYASRYFRSRYQPSFDPTICTNFYDVPPELDATFPNGSRIYGPSRKYYGKFICPLTADHGLSFCCGIASRQYCCSFWQDTRRSIAASFGLFVGVCAVIWLTGICLRTLGRCCPKLRRCTNDCSRNASQCCRRACRLPPNEVTQGPTVFPNLPSSNTQSPPPEAPKPSPAPLTVAPLAPPSYSSLNLRDPFGTDVGSDLPPPPAYEATNFASTVDPPSEGAGATPHGNH